MIDHEPQDWVRRFQEGDRIVTDESWADWAERNVIHLLAGFAATATIAALCIAFIHGWLR